MFFLKVLFFVLLTTVVVIIVVQKVQWRVSRRRLWHRKLVGVEVGKSETERVQRRSIRTVRTVSAGQKT